MLQIVTGNILDAQESFICQQVNCQNAMGAGLAKVLYSKWPAVKQDYHDFCHEKEPAELLGAYQIVPVDQTRSVVNIFGQLEFGRKRGKVYTRYDALETAFSALHHDHPDASLAFPFGFGCGLANGDWDMILSLIEKHFLDHEITIYRLDS